MMETSWDPPSPLKNLKEKLNLLKPSQWLHEIFIYKIVCHPFLLQPNLPHATQEKNHIEKGKKKFKPLCTKNACKPPCPRITLLKNGEN
jgi:hypothetical protein